MVACTLHIGSRRVLVSDEGPPAAEFALFDSSDVELSQGEGGTLRESGYRTTAGEAANRLAVAGITHRDRGGVRGGRARADLPRRMRAGLSCGGSATLLGAAELFDGGTYNTTLRRYDGAWLDLPLLANDAEIARATGVLHASCRSWRC